MVSLVLCSGYGALCLGEFLQIIGVATTHWIDYGDVVHEGLFERCTPITYCQEIEDVSKELKAVRAVVLLGLFSGLVAIVFSTVVFINRLTRKPVTMLMLFVCMLAGIGAFILTMVGIGVYVERIYNSIFDNLHVLVDVNQGYSFGLTVAGGILMGVAGILVIIGGRQSVTGEYSPLLASRN